MDSHTNMELPDGTTVGQNLAASSSSRYEVGSGVRSWISEEKFYDFDTLTCQGGWKPCGHLTQARLHGTHGDVHMAALMSHPMNH